MTRLILTVLFATTASLGLAAEAPKPAAKPKAVSKTKAKAKAPKAKAKAKPKAAAKPTPAPATFGPGTYALLRTERGEILLQLFPEQSPNTVANFVELAKGERPWKDAKGRWVARPYYEGLTFHRIEKGQLIQGGCPKGDGTGGPGYEFDNEASDDLKFDQPGRVAMANAGRNTNGSQFFITLEARPQYDGRFTIFGKVVHGLDVVTAISRMPATGTRIHKATKPVVMKSVTVTVVPPKAKPPAK